MQPTCLIASPSSFFFLSPSPSICSFTFKYWYSQNLLWNKHRLQMFLWYVFSRVHPQPRQSKPLINWDLPQSLFGLHILVFSFNILSTGEYCFFSWNVFEDLQFIIQEKACVPSKGNLYWSSLATFATSTSMFLCRGLHSSIPWSTHCTFCLPIFNSRL